jgi:GDP-L-fucose synthase
MSNVFERNKMKVLVTGGTGMVGKALKKILPDATYLSSMDCDLRDVRGVSGLFFAHKPDAVIHLAARVGGIKDNSDFIYDYFVQNLRINTNVINACVELRIPKVIALSSTCVYPAVVESYPIKEEVLHKGYPEKTNYGYAFAKRMMQVQIEAARRQYGLNWSVVYPSNLYGPHDTFDLQKSHVIPALMLKFHNAVKEGKDIVELYGTGLPLRQLTYVDDLAKMLLRILNSDISGEFNFANPRNYSIAEIAQAVAKVTNYWGSIHYNGKLDGIHRKDVDISKISSVFALEPFVDLDEGLRRTYDWYLQQTLAKEGV